MRQQLSSNHTIETSYVAISTAKSHEMLWAQTTVLESQNKDSKKVVGRRKEQANGVRAIIKGKHFKLLTVGEVYDKVDGAHSAQLNSVGNQRGIPRLIHH